MNIVYHMPVKIILGKNAVQNNKNAFYAYGKNAVIICGKTSARLSGALDDVENVLKQGNMNYFLYDDIGNNPTVENVYQAAAFAKGKKADFIIGIGGGSPLDAAKIVALLCCNDIEQSRIFEPLNIDQALPMILIPTTAGTGSETTPYSILTNDLVQNKKSISHPLLYPKVAILDATYIEKLPSDILHNTVIDALSHSIEGYLSVKSNPMSDVYAIEAMNIFGKNYQALIDKNIDFNGLEQLLYASTLGGTVIAQAGCTIVHSMGYPLTYFKNVPHGKANGLLLCQFLRFNLSHAPEKICNILNALGLKTIDALEKIIFTLIENDVQITEQEIDDFVSVSIKAANVMNNPKSVAKQDEIEMFRNVFLV